MGLTGLHVPCSLSPVLVNAIVEQANHVRAKVCRNKQQHALRVYETETRGEPISKPNTFQRQQLVAKAVLSGSPTNVNSAKAAATTTTTTRAGLKAGDTNESFAHVGSVHKQGTCHNQPIVANHSLPLFKQASTRDCLSLCRGKEDSGLVNDNESSSSSLLETTTSLENNKHITQQQVSLNYSRPHPLENRIIYKSKFNCIKQANTSKRFKPNTLQALLISLFSLTLFITILFQNTSQAKSVQEDNESNLLRNQLLEHEVILTTAATTTSDSLTTPVSTRSTLGELFSKFSGVFKKSIATTTTTTTPIPTTTTTTTESETDNYTEDESSSGRDDDDAEGCSGLSTHESAETKNLTDNERLVNLQSCVQRKVKKTILKATRDGLEVFEKLSLSGGCSYSLMKLASGLGEIKSFAFKCK